LTGQKIAKAICGQIRSNAKIAIFLIGNLEM